MNTSNHDWLNDKPMSDNLWLSMLVDGELSVSQRQAYIAHITETNHWQEVATAFLDEQFLQTHVAAPQDSTANVIDAAPMRRQPARQWVYYMAMVASLVCGLMIGPWLQNDESSGGLVDAPTTAKTQENETVKLAENAFRPSLPGLFQVSDTIDEAVYYADFSLPQFMLDALVLAGHRVTLDQEFLGYTETSDNPAAVPINVIHIQKYGRLMAALP